MLSDRLLQTKLERPRIPRNYVLRLRLIGRLDEALRVPLTLIAATAGYGKSTLVSAWIENLAGGDRSLPPVPAAWLSLDQTDSDLGVFLRYAIAAIGKLFDGACSGTQELIHAGQRPPADLLVATFANELAALPRDFVLVLDDAQSLTGTAVSDLLSELLLHWPQPMHLVVITRHDPALPLAPLRANGQVVEIRTRDLRFTPDETGAFLHKALARPLARSTVESLERQTEGWIAGLQLAAVSLLGAEDLESQVSSIEGADATFAEYLTAEVLAKQPAPVQAFLLRTAFLDAFCGPLCQAVVGADPGADAPGNQERWSVGQCIDWLDRRNLFIVSLDNRREWFRYHRLLQDALQERALVALPPGEIDDVRRRAAVWYARRGPIGVALRYALAAHDLPLAASLMEASLRDVLNREDRPTIEQWLSLLPEDLIEKRPGLLMIKAWSLHFCWQLNRQARVVQQVARLLDLGAGSYLRPEELSVLRGQVAALLGQIAFQENDLEKARTAALEGLVLLPASWQFVRGGAMLYLALTMQASGQGAAAEEYLLQAYQELADKTSMYALRMLQARCVVQYARAGDLEDIRQTAQRIAEEATRRRFPVLQSWGWFMWGLAHFQREELELAGEQFAKLVQNPYTGQIAVVRDGATRLALIYAATGRLVDALRTADFVTQIDLAHLGVESDQTGAMRARIALLQGDLASASRWAEALSGPVPNRAFVWDHSPHLVKAQVLLARGRPADLEEAVCLVSDLRDLAQRTYNARLQIEALAARALALAAQGKTAEARIDFLKAVALAQPGGFIRPFVNLGPAMQDILADLAGRRGAPDSIRHILAAFPERVASASPAGTTGGRAVNSLVEPLTPRELEILQLMAEPWSLKEIAAKLFISHETAKRHSVNIYGKLGVNRRREALDTAMDLGILPRR